MDIDMHSAQVERLHVVETGRRRRWSDEEKLRIVMESASGPRLVSSTARRYKISVPQLFGWRKSFGVLKPTDRPSGRAEFFPVAIESGKVEVPKSGTRVGGAARIEIEVPCGRILRVDAEIDTGVLARLLSVVDPRP
jgi:transposase